MDRQVGTVRLGHWYVTTVSIFPFLHYIIFTLFYLFGHFCIFTHFYTGRHLRLINLPQKTISPPIPKQTDIIYYSMFCIIWVVVSVVVGENIYVYVVSVNHFPPQLQEGDLVYVMLCVCVCVCDVAPCRLWDIGSPQ